MLLKGVRVGIIVIFLVLRFIPDHASPCSQLKIKESFHNEQLKPELNKQVEHVSSVVVVFLNLSTAVYREV